MCSKWSFSCENVQRTSTVVVMGALEPNLIQFLHKRELYLQELYQVQVNDQTADMLSSFTKRESIRQMLSLLCLKSLNLMFMLC